MRITVSVERRPAGPLLAPTTAAKLDVDGDELHTARDLVDAGRDAAGDLALALGLEPAEAKPALLEPIRDHVHLGVAGEARRARVVEGPVLEVHDYAERFAELKGIDWLARIRAGVVDVAIDVRLGENYRTGLVELAGTALAALEHHDRKAADEEGPDA